jgi:hypothetical protein
MLTHPKEILTWIDVDDKYPDTEITVLLFVPGHSEPVWPGYYDEGGEWRFCNGAVIDFDVVAWAEMPVGPQPNQNREEVR